MLRFNFNTSKIFYLSFTAEIRKTLSDPQGMAYNLGASCHRNLDGIFILLFYYVFIFYDLPFSATLAPFPVKILHVKGYGEKVALTKLQRWKKYLLLTKIP